MSFVLCLVEVVVNHFARRTLPWREMRRMNEIPAPSARSSTAAVPLSRSCRPVDMAKVHRRIEVSSFSFAPASPADCAQCNGLGAQAHRGREPPPGHDHPGSDRARRLRLHAQLGRPRQRALRLQKGHVRPCSYDALN